LVFASLLFEQVESVGLMALCRVDAFFEAHFVSYTSVVLVCNTISGGVAVLAGEAEFHSPPLID
jgi:hypothetical protein